MLDLSKKYKVKANNAEVRCLRYVQTSKEAQQIHNCVPSYYEFEYMMEDGRWQKFVLHHDHEFELI